MSRISIIDDDIIICKMLEGILSDNYEVETFISTEDALEAYVTRPCDLVITDIVMPQIDGLTTIYEFRRLNLSLPIIAISGESIFKDDHYKKMAERIGADRFLVKPIDPNLLLKEIQQLL